MTMEVDSGTEVPDPPAVLKEHTGLKWSVATDSESGLICLPLEYEEKELEKTPLPQEVVLTRGWTITCYTFSPVPHIRFFTCGRGDIFSS